MNLTEQLSSQAQQALTNTDVKRDSGDPTTLIEMFERAVSSHNKPDALNYKRDGKWHSIPSAEMLARIERIALGLYSLGVRQGERVALLSENCPEWTLADAGCLFAGAADVPIYSTQAPEQVRYILDDSGARLLFIQHKAAFERIAEAIRDCATLQHVVFFDKHGVDDTSAFTTMALAELEERGAQLMVEQPTLAKELAHRVKPDDLATIIYTSGTTGEPKGVMLSHSNFVSNLLDVSNGLDFCDKDIVLSVLPLSHVFERTAMYMYIHYGMSIHYAESLDRIGDNLREVRPTMMTGVPRLFEKMYARIKAQAAAGGKAKAAMLGWAVEVGKQWAEHSLNQKTISLPLQLKHKVASRLVFSKWRAGTGGRLRILIAGGAALPEELGYIFTGAGIPIVQCYGLTETSPGITVNTLTANRIGTVGRAIRNVEVRIASDGEIEMRGPNVMRGYFNKPEATRAVFTEDGWFKTGDIGTLDSDGFLRITDRKKELLKTSGGKYIAPQPIEARIKGSRFVNQVVLIGNGRRFPAALIVPDWDALRSYAKLKSIEAKTPAEFCEHPRILDLFQRQVDSLCEDLAQYERVKRIALLPQELTIEGGELTPTLKVKRRVVDEKYRDVINKLYEEQ